MVGRAGIEVYAGFFKSHGELQRSVKAQGGSAIAKLGSRLVCLQVYRGKVGGLKIGGQVFKAGRIIIVVSAEVGFFDLRQMGKHITNSGQGCGADIGFRVGFRPGFYLARIFRFFRRRFEKRKETQLNRRQYHNGQCN